MYDAETGLYYLRTRYYDPSIGRFLNEDTYEGQIDNPLSQNLYTYVTNNPLIYTDPTGHYNNHYDHGGSGGFLIRFRSNFKTSPERLPEKIKTPSTPVRKNLTQSEVDSLRAETNSLRARAASESEGNSSWSMARGGDVINGRKYSEHALERMAPDTIEVRAELTTRAKQMATSKGLQPGTKEYNDYIKKYVDPRGLPPSVVEDTIQNGTKTAGNTPGTNVFESDSVKVVTNSNGDVVTVIPK